MNATDWIAKANRAVASAKLLLEAGDLDGACNRAYYAMFDLDSGTSNTIRANHTVKIFCGKGRMKNMRRSRGFSSNTIKLRKKISPK